MAERPEKKTDSRNKIFYHLESPCGNMRYVQVCACGLSVSSVSACLEYGRNEDGTRCGNDDRDSMWKLDLAGLRNAGVSLKNVEKKTIPRAYSISMERKMKDVLLLLFICAGNLNLTRSPNL